MSGPLILAIESSCDETGIALVEGGRRIHGNVVASQVALHATTGGIVPEVAARAHLGLGEALLRLGAERLAAGDADDLAELVPEYVTLPRGVREQAGAMAWSRDHR